MGVPEGPRGSWSCSQSQRGCPASRERGQWELLLGGAGCSSCSPGTSWLKSPRRGCHSCGPGPGSADTPQYTWPGLTCSPPAPWACRPIPSPTRSAPCKGEGLSRPVGCGLGCTQDMQRADGRPPSVAGQLTCTSGCPRRILPLKYLAWLMANRGSPPGCACAGSACCSTPPGPLCPGCLAGTSPHR